MGPCCAHACMVTYAQAGLHWSRVLTLRLGPQVKLVGSTISCEPAWEGADTSRTKRQNPHVQSYVMATDQVCCMHPGYPGLNPQGTVTQHLPVAPSLH